MQAFSVGQQFYAGKDRIRILGVKQVPGCIAGDDYLGYTVEFSGVGTYFIPQYWLEQMTSGKRNICPPTPPSDDQDPSKECAS